MLLINKTEIVDKITVKLRIKFFALQYAYVVAWSRKDGQRLSSSVMDDGQGTLTVRNVQPYDATTYVCTGSNIYTTATDEAVLVLGGKLLTN